MAKQTLHVTVDKNEISRTGKLVAGILLVGFTLLPIVLIIGLWPNKMPGADSPGYYQNQLFDIALITDANYKGSQIHINTILFILVALSGFMGSMVHLSTSFTNYIGAGRFKRDWTLWYCVKPFTAAGVAVIFYMVLNAGLLSGGGSGASINPYGIVILAALAGLFTDKATMKLEEVFTILFQPKDERPDRMDEKAVTITGFDPKKLVLDKDNNITIKGTNLDQANLAVKINGEDVQNIKVEKDAVSFSYKVAEALSKEKKLTLSVFDGVRLLQTGEFELGSLADDGGAIMVQGQQQSAEDVAAQTLQPDQKQVQLPVAETEEEAEPAEADEIIKG